MAPIALSIGIVTFEPDPPLLERAMGSLARAVGEARAAGVLGDVELFIVDNGPGGASLEAVRRSLAAWPRDAGRIELLADHGNVGYGRANNLALERARSDAHLVMNPDVEVDADALRAGVEALRSDPALGLVAPAVTGDDGEAQYLCKRYPSAWVLFLRGFAPGWMRRRHAGAIARYEMRDVIGDRVVKGVPLASGCFMLARTALLSRLGGFDPRFFMYFEDYDLSLRVAREARIDYVPAVRIRHHGGEASRKGARHVGWFVASAARFFSRHGWRLR